MEVKAIIFDLDGTLLDSLTDIGLAANRTLERFGLPAKPIDAYRYLVGRGAEFLVRNCLPADVTESFVSDFLESYLDDYDHHHTENTSLYAGIPEMLDAIAGFGIPMSVLSNKLNKTTNACVDRFLSQWEFARVWGSGRGYPRKPDPTAALTIAEQTCVDPKGFLFVGDTNIDMKTATAAGMRSIGVSWGFRPVRELREAGAEIIIDHPVDLIQYIK